jgi:hypothetical protein
MRLLEPTYKTMKQVLIIIFLGMLTMNAHAQDSTAKQHRFMLGMHGGAGLASLVGSDRHWGNAKDLTYMMGSIHGITFQYRASQRVSFCFETNFERKGYAIEGPYPGWWQPHIHHTIPWSEETKYIYDCISIPALVQFKINSRKKRTEWFVKTGLSPEYMVRSGVIYGNEKRFEDIQHIDFSAVAGFGVNIPVKKHIVISIEGRDNLTLGDLLSFKRHNLLVLMVGLGYNI